jgi:hypothetical protein
MGTVEGHSPLSSASVNEEPRDGGSMVIGKFGSSLTVLRAEWSSEKDMVRGSNGGIEIVADSHERYMVRY